MTAEWRGAILALALPALATTSLAQTQSQQATGPDHAQFEALQERLMADLGELEAELRAFPSPELESMVGVLRELLSNLIELRERQAAHEVE